MIAGFLPLLCLGLSLGYENATKNDTLPKPSLHALPGSVVGRRGNVTLKCRGHFQNVTFTLGKRQDPGYRQEQSSAGSDADFLLTGLEPEHAGTYFCVYKATGGHAWSAESDHLQLEVTVDRDGLGASSTKADTRIIFVAAFSCLTIFLLFPSVFLVYRCSQRGSSHEEPTDRTSLSKNPKQEASDLPEPERVSLSLSTEDPQAEAGADGHSKAEEPPGIL